MWLLRVMEVDDTVLEDAVDNDNDSHISDS
jgi:hypothetical protein